MLSDTLRELYYVPLKVLIPIIIFGAFFWFSLFRNFYRHALSEDERMQEYYCSSTSFRWGAFLASSNFIIPNVLRLGMIIGAGVWIYKFFSGECEFWLIFGLIPLYFLIKLCDWICRCAIGRARWAFLILVALDSLYLFDLPLQWALLFPIGNLLYIIWKWRAIGRDFEKLELVLEARATNYESIKVV